MNVENFNMELRKFLKKVGVSSQASIEKSINEAIADGRLKGDETLDAKMTLTIDSVDLTFDIEGRISLN